MNEQGNHHAGHSHPSTTQALWIAFLLNFSFMVVEIIAGLLTNSLVLLSDAGHMVSDVAALGLALLTQKLVTRHPGGSFTFGYRRAPVLGAFGNALTLYIIVVLIFREAWIRLITPPEVMGMPVLIVGILGLLINGTSAFWLHRTGDLSLNIRGAILHLVADALGSIGAIIAAIVMLTTGSTLADPIVSIFIGCLIMIGSWPLFRDSIKVLLQAAPPSIDMVMIRDLLLAEPLIEHIADFHIWELNSGEIVFMATVIAVSDSITIKEIEDINDRLRQSLARSHHIEHVTLEWRRHHGSMIGCEKDPETKECF